MKSKQFDTPKPVITPQQLEKIRTAARRYLLAGGSAVIQREDNGLDDHISNVRELIQPGYGEAFSDLLETHLPVQAHYDAHEAVSSAAWLLAAAVGEAGFAFGVAVGCELIAQSLGINVLPPHIWKCDSEAVVGKGRV